MRPFRITAATALKIWGNPITVADFNKYAKELFPDRPRAIRTFSPNELRSIRAAAGLGPRMERYGRPLVFTFNSAKGGVGKTSFTASLSVIFMLMGYKVLVIDGDPQASCTSLFGYEPDEQAVTLRGLLSGSFAQPFPDAVHHVYEDGALDLLGSGYEMTHLEESMSEQPYHGITSILDFFDKESAYIGEYDLILVDTNPWTPRLNVAYAYASDYIFVPADLEGLSIRTLREFFTKNEKLSKSKHLKMPRIPKVKLIANRDEKTRPERNRNLLILADKYPEELAPVSIPQSTSFLKQAQVARAESRPLAEIDTSSECAKSMHDLARYIEEDLINQEVLDAAA